MDHWLTYLILIIQYGLITDLLSNIIWLCSVVVLYIVHYGWCNQVSWPRLRRLRGDASSSSWAKAASTTHRWSINHQSPVTWAVLYLFYLESCMFVYRPSPQEVWMLLFFSHFSLKNLKRAITPLNRDKSLQSRNHLNPSSTIRHGPAWCWNPHCSERFRNHESACGSCGAIKKLPWPRDVRGLREPYRHAISISSCDVSTVDTSLKSRGFNWGLPLAPLLPPQGFDGFDTSHSWETACFLRGTHVPMGCRADFDQGSKQGRTDRGCRTQGAYFCPYRYVWLFAASCCIHEMFFIVLYSDVISRFNVWPPWEMDILPLVSGPAVAFPLYTGSR